MAELIEQYIDYVDSKGRVDKVRTEMSLHVLAYNLKRMITIFGVGPLMAAIRT